MVEVKGAYKHGGYDKMWLKSLHVMSNIKIFVMQNGQPAACLSGQRGEQDRWHRSMC